MPLVPFEDVRHESGIYAHPSGQAGRLLEATLAATDLVMVAPVYWYCLPARAKEYLDQWAGWMRVPGLSFIERMKSKNFWSLHTVSGEDRSDANPSISSLQLTARYLKMQWRGSVVGIANRPGDIQADEMALRQAADLFGDEN